MADTAETSLLLWHFTCPECGAGDREHGWLALDAELHCELCLADDGRRVRLRRWLPETPPG